MRYHGRKKSETILSSRIANILPGKSIKQILNHVIALKWLERISPTVALYSARNSSFHLTAWWQISALAAVEQCWTELLCSNVLFLGSSKAPQGIHSSSLSQDDVNGPLGVKCCSERRAVPEFVCWERRSILFILCSLNASWCLFACCLLLATHTCNKHCYSPLLEYKPSLMGCKIRFRCICMHTALCAALPCSSASAEEANWSKALSGGDHRVQLSLKIWVLVHCLGIWCGESLYSYLHRDVWNKWGNVAS